MKTCGNCRRVWPDDYNGQCEDCGASMAGTPQVRSGGDLASRYARQRRTADAEAALEGTLRAGGHGSIRVPDQVYDAALALLVPKEGAFTDE